MTAAAAIAEPPVPVSSTARPGPGAPNAFPFASKTSRDSLTVLFVRRDLDRNRGRVNSPLILTNAGLMQQRAYAGRDQAFEGDRVVGHNRNRPGEVDVLIIEKQGVAADPLGVDCDGVVFDRGVKPCVQT